MEEVKQFYVIDTYFFDIDDEMIRTQSDIVSTEHGVNDALGKAKKIAKNSTRELEVYYEFKISQVLPVLAYSNDPHVPEEEKLQVF